MSTDLYIIIILLILFIVMILAMIYLVHSGNVFASMLACFISCIVALIAATPVIVFDAFSHASLTSMSASQISVQEISKISPKDNSDTLFNVTYTDTENIDRRITVKEIVYDSDTTYIEKARKTFMFLYEDSYVLHEPQGFINNN